MAIVKFADIIVGARGTFGGVTYSANRAGPYIKTWAKSSNPRSTSQTAQRTRFAEFSSAWRNLTASQQTDWNDYALDPAQQLTNSLGETYTVPGIDWFVKINMQRSIVGLSQRDDAPTLAPITITALSNFSIATTGAVQFDIDITEFPGGAQVIAHLSFAPSVGRNVYPTNRRFIYSALNPGTDTRNVPASNVTNAFGTPIAGTRWRLDITCQNGHGRRGNVLTAQVNL